MARSPDLATLPTEESPTATQAGDLWSSGRRGPETSAEPLADGEVRRPPPNHQRTARSGDLRRTTSGRRGQETCAEPLADGEVQRPPPNHQRTARSGDLRRTTDLKLVN